MKENYIIATRPHNALLVFKYECIPDKTVWDKEKYIGAYSRLVLRSLGEGGSEKTSSGFISLRRDKQVERQQNSFRRCWGCGRILNERL